MNDSFLSVGLIGPNDASRLEITRELSGPEVGVLRDYYQSFDSDGLSKLIAQNHDVIIIDLDHDQKYALDLVKKLSSDRFMTLMVYSEHSGPELTLRCLQAGAHEFLALPLAPGTMAGAMVRASARRPVSSRIKEASGQLLVFFGVKGGVGVTTLASNFALLLGQESGKRTLLIDLDLPLGDIALNLGLSGKYSTIDALQNATRLDSYFLSTLLQTYGDGLSVLAAPGQFVNMIANSKAIDKLIAVARREFDYVVVDSGSRLNFIDTDLYRDAVTIYMVTQTGVPELRNANRLIGQFPTKGRPQLQIVINRFTTSFNGLDDQTIAKALTRPADWKVPNDYITASRTQNTATPLAFKTTPISKVLRQMARSACGMAEIPEKKRWFFARS